MIIWLVGEGGGGGDPKRRSLEQGGDPRRKGLTGGGVVVTLPPLGRVGGGGGVVTLPPMICFGRKVRNSRIFRPLVHLTHPKP